MNTFYRDACVVVILLAPILAQPGANTPGRICLPFWSPRMVLICDHFHVLSYNADQCFTVEKVLFCLLLSLPNALSREIYNASLLIIWISIIRTQISFRVPPMCLFVCFVCLSHSFLFDTFRDFEPFPGNIALPASSWSDAHRHKSDTWDGKEAHRNQNEPGWQADGCSSWIPQILKHVFKRFHKIQRWSEICACNWNKLPRYGLLVRAGSSADADFALYA